MSDATMRDSFERPLTTRQVAEILELSYDATLKRIQRGQIPARRYGRQYRVFLSDLITCMNSLPAYVPQHTPVDVLPRLKSRDSSTACDVPHGEC